MLDVVSARSKQRSRMPTYEATFADMTERDRRDSSRTDSPSGIAEDAIVVDSTGLSIDEVFKKMMSEVLKNNS